MGSKIKLTDIVDLENYIDAIDQAAAKERDKHFLWAGEKIEALWRYVMGVESYGDRGREINARHTEELIESLDARLDYLTLDVAEKQKEHDAQRQVLWSRIHAQQDVIAELKSELQDASAQLQELGVAASMLQDFYR